MDGASSTVETVCRRCKRLWRIDESGAAVYRSKYGTLGYAVVEECPECREKAG